MYVYKHKIQKTCKKLNFFIKKGVQRKKQANWTYTKYINIQTTDALTAEGKN